MNFKKIIFLNFFILIFMACASKSPKVFMFQNIKNKEKVVLLPLKNNSKNIAAGRIIYRILLSDLIKSERFEPIEEGEVRNFMQKNMLYPGDIPNYNQLSILKSITKADILIGGDVLDAGNINGDVKITLILWARDINNGKLLWTTYYVKRGDDYRKIFHFGKVYSIGELSLKMIDDIVKSWEREGG